MSQGSARARGEVFEVLMMDLEGYEAKSAHFQFQTLLPSNDLKGSSL